MGVSTSSDSSESFDRANAAILPVMTTIATAAISIMTLGIHDEKPWSDYFIIFKDTKNYIIHYILLLVLYSLISWGIRQ